MSRPLTKTDDTNVTLTLGGSPTDCLLRSTSLTLGWTGVLSEDRGGTGTTTGARERLSAARNYYVRTDGSDSNTGLANTAAGAFLTLNAAAAAIYALDLGGYNVQVNIADGTYTGGLNFIGPIVGKGNIAFVGNTTTPANVVISTTAVATGALGVTNVAKGNIISLYGMKVQTTTSGAGLLIQEGSRVFVSNLDYGATAGAQVDVRSGSSVRLLSGYTISGGGTQHILARDPGTQILWDSQTITLTGTPAFTGAFVNVFGPCYLEIAGNTFSGSATGQRYSSILNAIINTGGAGTSALPGNSVGSTGSGGQYL